MLTEMTKKCVFITLEDSNLEVNMDCGVRAGLAADSLGIHKAAQKVFIEVREKIDK